MVSDGRNLRVVIALERIADALETHGVKTPTKTVHGTPVAKAVIRPDKDGNVKLAPEVVEGPTFNEVREACKLWIQPLADRDKVRGREVMAELIKKFVTGGHDRFTIETVKKADYKSILKYIKETEAK